MKKFTEGKRAGYVDITTRSPAQVLNYMRYEIAPKVGGTLTEMYAVMIDEWFKARLWERGFPWRKTMALSKREEQSAKLRTGDGAVVAADVTITKATGWVQVNMRLQEAQANRVRALAQLVGESPSTVLYTIIFWWTWFRNPPPEIAERRRREREARNKQLVKTLKSGGVKPAADAVIKHARGSSS